MENLIPIGHFSNICKISIRSLRHYDEIDLLKPHFVDEETGYRYYTYFQFNKAESIKLLRSMDISLEDIKQIINENNDEKVKELLNVQKALFREKIAKFEENIDFIENLIINKDGSFNKYNVKVKEIDPQMVIYVSEKTNRTNLSKAINDGFFILCEYMKQFDNIKVVDNTYTIFLDKVFDDNEINIEVCIPINIEVKETDIVHFRKVDKFTAVYTEHKGSYDTIQLAYKTIYQWIQEHGYFPSMYSREVYIISPDNSDSPKEYLTEVAFPIE